MGHMRRGSKCRGRPPGSPDFAVAEAVVVDISSTFFFCQKVGSLDDWSSRERPAGGRRLLLAWPADRRHSADKQQLTASSAVASRRADCRAGVNLVLRPLRRSSGGRLANGGVSGHG